VGIIILSLGLTICYHLLTAPFILQKLPTISSFDCSPRIRGGTSEQYSDVSSFWRRNIWQCWSQGL